MNQSEVLKLSIEELKEQLVEQKMKYNELKMAHAVSPLENPIYDLWLVDCSNDKTS